MNPLILSGEVGKEMIDQRVSILLVIQMNLRSIVDGGFLLYSTIKRDAYE